MLRVKLRDRPQRVSSRARLQLAHLAAVATMVMATATRLHGQLPAFSSQNEDASQLKARLEISEFHALWQAAWQRSEDVRRSRFSKPELQQRVLHANCNDYHFKDRFGWWAQAEASHRGLPGTQYRMIEGVRPDFGVCPSWFLGEVVDAEDERRWRDGALVPKERARIAQPRNRLIEKLRGHLQSTPENTWLSGQLVRLLLDARRYDDAQQQAEHCHPHAAWCDGLRGLVWTYRDSTVKAEQAFARMLDRLPEAERCMWQRLTPLLEEQLAARYADLSCERQAALNDTIWWLADPLYRDAGNERKVEQYVRRMEIALRQATGQDERYAFDQERMGDALAAVIDRFGWPSYTAALGTMRDRWQSHRRSSMPTPAPPAPPYSTFEYAPQAVSSFASRRSVSAPYGAQVNDWTLHPYDLAGAPVLFWWPKEHFQATRRLVQIEGGQCFFLRRHTYVEVALSIPLRHPAIRDGSGDFDVLLLKTNGPTSVDSIAQQMVAGNAIARMRGAVASGPTLLAVEALATNSSNLAARTRYGITVPPPLSELQAGKGISGIALLSDVPDSVLTHPSEQALAFMMPSREANQSVPSLVLYWENYGITVHDSATTTVRIVSTASPGLFRRLGVLSGMVADGDNALAVTWPDHEPRGYMSTLAGPTPVQMRMVSLNLSGLPAGTYDVSIRSRLKNGQEFSTSTAFTKTDRSTTR